MINKMSDVMTVCSFILLVASQVVSQVSTPSIGVQSINGVNNHETKKKALE
ncbi:hypothetical protein [Ligilactobacillus acidipiscis]|uniref:hypothetical protein n=1 Tax=Ligilactobacillus acidipiscis TaxID=89059 RepID=UPI0023F9A00A|nr:hypothetical protein [Ligilactobacillus acidipiscis]WEV57457.1 hypothetical protein OZX66_02615 [Ligilactobacillus acidipiscis]